MKTLVKLLSCLAVCLTLVGCDPPGFDQPKEFEKDFQQVTPAEDQSTPVEAVHDADAKAPTEAK